MSSPAESPDPNGGTHPVRAEAVARILRALDDGLIITFHEKTGGAGWHACEHHYTLSRLPPKRAGDGPVVYRLLEVEQIDDAASVPRDLVFDMARARLETWLAGRDLAGLEQACIQTDGPGGTTFRRLRERG